MIDTLVSGKDKQNLPKELTEQRDGKLVDHMFVGQGLIEQSDLTSELTYYIGDSKYYKRAKNDRTQLGDKSIYKQYTYARNVIQWNMNLFLDGDGNGEHPQLRDTLTEGYNPIPNFFISARIPDKKTSGGKFLSFDDKELKAQDGGVQLNRQFENRLFDRDTLLLCHYDVNFCTSFRCMVEIIKVRKRHGETMSAKNSGTRFKALSTDSILFVPSNHVKEWIAIGSLKENFSQLNGKLYRSMPNKNYLVLALMKDDEESKGLWKRLKVRDAVIKDEIAENESALQNVQTHFYVSEAFELTTELQIENIPNVGTLEQLPQQSKKSGVLMVMMENYEMKSSKFLPTGKIAIGIKYTRDSIEIVENLQSIGYVLFHTRKDMGQHLFPATNIRLVKFTEEVPTNIYKNVSTTEMYVLVVFDNLSELDSSSIHSAKKAYTPTTRYDAQYTEINEILTIK